LWAEKDYFSFDVASRERGFVEYSDDAQFSQAMFSIAELAKDRILALRKRFATVEKVAANLDATKAPLNESPWQTFHAAIALGCAGREKRSRLRFDEIAAWTPDHDWGRVLKGDAAQMASLLQDPLSFKAAVKCRIERCRALLKMPAAKRLDVFH